MEGTGSNWCYRIDLVVGYVNKLLMVDRRGEGKQQAATGVVCKLWVGLKIVKHQSCPVS